MLGSLATVLKMGLFVLGANLMVILGLGSCSVPQTHPKNVPSADFQLELCINSQIVFYFGLWTIFYAGFWITFCTGFYFGYRPTAFLSFCCRVCPNHSAGLAVVSMTLQRTFHRATSYIGEEAKPILFSGASSASVEDVHLRSLSLK